jgi:predicted Zn-dependent protease
MISGMAVASAVLGLQACAPNAATGRSSLSFYSESEERKLGAKSHPEILEEFGGAYQDPALNAYVSGLGSRLVQLSERPDIGFTFTIIDSPIVNAFALPGGYVYITRGLLALAQDEAELAGVLGHEIGHVMARHTVERLSQANLANIGLTVLGVALGNQMVADVAGYGAMAYLQSYSRDQEFEADRLGIRYIAKAGYAPDQMSEFLANLDASSRLEAMIAGRSPDEVDKFDIMATHPRTPARVQAAAREALADGHGGSRIGREDFLQVLDGLVYGDSPAHGIANGRLFQHPGLGFEFQVPPGFRIMNSSKDVKALHPSGSIIIFDMVPALGQTDMTSFLRQQWAARTRLNGLEAISVNGLPGATGATQGSTSRGPVEVRFVALLMRDRIARFLFITPGAETAALNMHLRRTTYSLRVLSARERAAVTGRKVKVHAIRSGETVESLAATLPFEDFKVERLRVLNGLSPQAVLPPPGTRIKIIV